MQVQLSSPQMSDVVAPSLAVWHAPPTCPGLLTDLASAEQLGLAVNTLCVSSPCDGWMCNITVALPRATQYVLRVHARVLSTLGTELSILWNYHRCSDGEFSVLAPNGTLTCVTCPNGGDCRPASGEGKYDVVSVWQWCSLTR
jgi:hypothetical protein